MTRHPLVRHISLSRPLVALAVLAAFAPAHAEETTKDSEVQASVSAGIGVSSGDSADRGFFGQYNGLRDQDVVGLAGFSYSRRYSSTGTWIEMIGSNLGLQTREIDFLWKRQGEWTVKADYGELLRRDPYTVNTGTVGAGTTTPQLFYLDNGPGSGWDLDLSTKRKGVGISAAKWLSPAFELAASFRSEDKEGSSRFGNGVSCPASFAPGCPPTTAASTGSAVLWLAEPVKSNHSQAEVRLNYGAGDLQLTGGYYGSFYRNRAGDELTASVPSTLNNPVGSPLPAGAGLQGLLQQPIALAPDNTLHSLDIGGSYAFTSDIRGNFKVAYSQASQDQDFTIFPGAPAGVSNLDGKIDTTLAQVGLTARPLPELSLAGTYRYRDVNDKTPIEAYNVVGPVTYTNYTVGRTVNDAKLDATYQFPARFLGTVGIDYYSIDRDPFTPTSSAIGVSALRNKTSETGYSVALRRSMTATLSGALTYRHSHRDGSDWLQPGLTGVTPVPDSAFGPYAIFSPTLADRDRDEIRFLTSWLPTDALSLQFNFQYRKDDFDAPSEYAVRNIRLNLFSVDADYRLSDEWNLNAYLSWAENKLDQARPGGYVIGFKDTGWNAGIGVSGRPSEKLQLGGSLSYIDNNDQYDQGIDSPALPGNAELLAAAGGLPEIKFKRTELRLFGNYNLSASSTFGLDAVYYRAKYDDWTYAYGGVPFVFGDNTTLSYKQTQNVVYVGVRYIYTWR